VSWLLQSGQHHHHHHRHHLIVICSLHDIDHLALKRQSLTQATDKILMLKKSFASSIFNSKFMLKHICLSHQPPEMFSHLKEKETQS
jgi:hypothetical protein